MTGSISDRQNDAEHERDEARAEVERLRAVQAEDYVGIEKMANAYADLQAQMARLTEERAAECIGNAFEKWATDPTVRGAARRVVAMVQAAPRKAQETPQPEEAQIAAPVPAERLDSGSGGSRTLGGVSGAPAVEHVSVGRFPAFRAGDVVMGPCPVTGGVIVERRGRA